MLGKKGLMSLFGLVTKTSHERDEEERNGCEDQVTTDEDAEQLDGLLEQPGAEGQEDECKDDGYKAADQDSRPGCELTHLASHQELQDTLKNHSKT